MNHEHGTIAVVTLLMCLGKLYRYAQAKETDRRLREAHGDKYDALLAKLVDEQGIEALIDGHWAAPKIAAKRQLDG